MVGLSKIQPPLHLSLPHPSFPTPPSVSLCFLKIPSSTSLFSKTLNSSFASSSHHHITPLFLRKHNPSPHASIAPKQPSSPLSSTKNSLFSILKCISLSLATAALFFARFHHKPSIAVLPTAAPVDSTVQSSDAEHESEQEKEKFLEQYLESHPDDISSIRALMEVKIKLQKLPQAIDIIDRLIILQPEEKEWPVLRAHLYLYAEDLETAKSSFEDIISADPFRVEAYHGLAMAAMQSNQRDLEPLLKRIDGVIERCKKEKKEDVRDFRLLVAQVGVIEGKYEDALKIYQELVKEDPRDFRPYLCQGIIYTLLRKMDEADKQFTKYRRLVPKGHPYAEYFNDNVLATKVFSQMVEKDRVKSKR